jgi:hypothetical protein
MNFIEFKDDDNKHNFCVEEFSNGVFITVKDSNLKAILTNNEIETVIGYLNFIEMIKFIQTHKDNGENFIVFSQNDGHSSIEFGKLKKGDVDSTYLHVNLIDTVHRWN